MSPIRIGVVGCGAIAQVHHMPNLLELQDEFEVTAVCDVSAGAAAYVAKRFHVPHYFTDYRDLLAADVDAVLLCQSDPKTDVAAATAARAAMWDALSALHSQLFALDDNWNELAPRLIDGKPA